MNVSSYTNPVPELTVESFLGWINNPQQARPLMDIGNFQRIQIQQLEDLYRYLAEPINQGYMWILLDGPKKQRPTWLIDPWWKTRPEMPEKLQKINQAHCVNTQKLYDILEQHFSKMIPNNPEREI